MQTTLNDIWLNLCSHGSSICNTQIGRTYVGKNCTILFVDIKELK